MDWGGNGNGAEMTPGCKHDPNAKPSRWIGSYKACRCFTSCGHIQIEDCERRLAALKAAADLPTGDFKLNFDLYLAAASCAVRVAEYSGVKNAHLLVPEQW